MQLSHLSSPCPFHQECYVLFAGLAIAGIAAKPICLALSFQLEMNRLEADTPQTNAKDTNSLVTLLGYSNVMGIILLGK